MNNNIVTIYHGSERIVESPEFGKGRPYNDYGLGFYTTLDKRLAGEWAVLNTEKDGYINEYTINVGELRVLKLDTLDIKHWIAVLAANRRGNFQEVTKERMDVFSRTFRY